MMKVHCLVLACGNTLRGDDGLGPWLAHWAEERFRKQPGLRIVSRQQWTPELAEELAAAASVLFIDCSAASPPGVVRLEEVQPAAPAQGLATHHLGAAELLDLARELYNSLPRTALLLTVGAGSTDLGEEFSAAVKDALPEARKQLETAVENLLKAFD